MESAPGEGSTFRLVLPGVPAQLPEPEPKPVAKSDLHGCGLILAVDDEPGVRDFLRAILERYGYSVLTAENGQDGVDVFRRSAETIAAVVLDLTMPVMGGSEAFRLMNEIRPGIPIVVSSGYGELSVRGQFAGTPAGVLKKPYTVSQLLDKLAAA